MDLRPNSELTISELKERKELKRKAKEKKRQEKKRRNNEFRVAHASHTKPPCSALHFMDGARATAVRKVQVVSTDLFSSTFMSSSSECDREARERGGEVRRGKGWSEAT